MKTTYKTYSDHGDVKFIEFETVELPENHNQIAAEYLAKQESDFEKKFGSIDKTPIMATRGRHQLFALFGLQGNRVRGVAREITPFSWEITRKGVTQQRCFAIPAYVDGHAVFFDPYEGSSSVMAWTYTNGKWSLGDFEFGGTLFVDELNLPAQEISERVAIDNLLGEFTFIKVV